MIKEWSKETKVVWEGEDKVGEDGPQHHLWSIGGQTVVNRWSKETKVVWEGEEKVGEDGPQQLLGQFHHVL